MENLWGERLEKIVEDITALDPNPLERLILRWAEKIKTSHKARLDQYLKTV